MEIWREISDLELQNSVDDVWEVLLRTLSKIGFDYAIYLTINSAGNNTFLRTNIPQVYDLIQVQEEPFFKHCCNSYEPVFTGIEFAAGYDFLMPGEIEFVRQASKATGFISGVALPMRLLGSNRFGGFNIGTSLTKNAFLALVNQRIEMLRFLCLIAHRRIEEISEDQHGEERDFRALLVAPEKANGVQLSPREREIIYLFSQGLSAKECAIACRISHHTIAEYSKNAYRKLGARNRAEAVKKFLALNLSRDEPG
ncbi:helix-turn-helix transcriptional regulator [Roseibium sp. SCP14]|uniref:helix-turn-helix transcriptional regulator n=1 Tax=Roseibium sp. SCP14 TaxID=3141375 RepID=UPI00333D66B1